MISEVQFVKYIRGLFPFLYVKLALYIFISCVCYGTKYSRSRVHAAASSVTKVIVFTSDENAARRKQAHVDVNGRECLKSSNMLNFLGQRWHSSQSIKLHNVSVIRHVVLH